MSERTAYWRRLLSEWEQSGLSQAEFCRRRGIKAVNLAWWKRRLRGSPGASRSDRERERGSPGASRSGRERVTRRAGRAAFVELALPSHRGCGELGYELVLPSGACLRLPGDFDPERVARLVRALEQAGGAGQAAC